MTPATDMDIGHDTRLLPVMSAAEMDNGHDTGQAARHDLGSRRSAELSGHMDLDRIFRRRLSYCARLAGSAGWMPVMCVLPAVSDSDYRVSSGGNNRAARRRCTEARLIPGLENR